MAERITNCNRCGREALGSDDGSPKARIFRRALKGECTECHVVMILKSIDEMHGGALFRYAPAPECFRHAHIQEQFGALMRAGKAEAVPDEIDWERVIDVWEIGTKDKARPLF